VTTRRETTATLRTKKLPTQPTNYSWVTKVPEEVAVDLTPGEQDDRPVPARDASFAEKMEYYRGQHTTKGIRATHLVGIPGVAFAIPLIAGRRS